MPGLNAATLLAAWERAFSQLPVRRALTLLSAAWPEKSEAAWAEATIGERDRYLLRLRDELFGKELEATTLCPACGERLQLAFSTEAIRADAPKSLPDDGRFHLVAGGYEVSARLPTSADLLEVARHPDREAREVLLRRCLDIVQGGGGETVDPAALPDEVVKTVTEQMAERDPQAEVRIALDCPACAHQWVMLFDILSYVWSEIDDWAQRLLMEVHVLASAYGWSERDIISMSARRRRLYLEMVGA